MKYLLLILKIAVGTSLALAIFFLVHSILLSLAVPAGEPASYEVLGKPGALAAGIAAIAFVVFGIISFSFSVILLATVLMLKKRGYEPEALRVKRLIYDIFIVTIVTSTIGAVYYLGQKIIN